MPKYKHSRPRGFAPWNPRTDTLLLLGHVQTVLDRESHAVTGRYVFYKMLPFGYPKTEQFYANLCDKLTRARRCGLIGWDEIEDGGRPYTSDEDGSLVYAFQSVSSFGGVLRHWARRFRIESNQFQPCHVEVHVETDGMVRSVARIVQPLGCTAYSASGFGSVDFQYRSAKRIFERDVPTVVLSVGDFDPSGISLYWSFKENVEAMYVDGHPDWQRPSNPRGSRQGPLFRRIAVTPEQIRRLDLPTAPAKRTDKRGDWQGDTVQCETIDSRELERILTEEVLKHYDETLIEAAEDLAEELRPGVSRLVGAIDWSGMDRRCSRGLSHIQGMVDPDADWMAGYDYSVDDDMEEGI